MLCAHGVFPWSCDRCRPSSVPRLGPAPAAGSATGPLPAASSLSGQSSLQPNRLLLRLVCPRGRTFSRLPSEGSRLPVVWDSLSDWCHSYDFLLVRGMPSPGLVCPSGQDAENVLGALPAKGWPGEGGRGEGREEEEQGAGGEELREEGSADGRPMRTGPPTLGRTRVNRHRVVLES